MRQGSYRTEVSAPLAAVLAAGMFLAGYLVVSRRRIDQRHRLAEHPDDAPATTRRAAPRDGAAVARSVTINRPRAELFAFWRDFRNLPTFMENIHAVAPAGPDRTVWTIGAPGGSTVDLETEITEERENEVIAWRSVEGSNIDTEGRVRFSDAAPGRGTIVEATVRYSPRGGELGRWIAKLFQRDPAVQARRELKRFKMLMETGEIATSRNRIEA